MDSDPLFLFRKSTALFSLQKAKARIDAERE